MAQVTVTVEFNNDGTATIRLPEGKMQKIDAAKVADFTDALSKAMGNVEERHIGDHHHHHEDKVGDQVQTKG